MTREEAIAYGKEQLDVFGGKHVEFIKLAIEALEQEPCEDCISRKNTLAEFKRAYFDNDTVIRCAELVLGDMPSVTSQPKTGHWIITRTFMHDGEFYCDKCKCDSPNNEKWDYCPNCGVKMREVEDEKNNCNIVRMSVTNRMRNKVQRNRK